MKPILELNNVSIQYYKKTGNSKLAVDHVSISIAPGEIVGLTGDSGCGKTTLARLITGLLSDHAQVEADGISKCRTSLVFQNTMSCLDPLMKIGKQIEETILLHQNCSRAEAKNKALFYLDQMGIRQPETCIHKYPFECSGGMNQRVALAVALACNPELLIADEPTTALDPFLQQQITHVMRTVCKSTNTSVLFISHDIELMNEICDRILYMDQGKIIRTSVTAGMKKKVEVNHSFLKNDHSDGIMIEVKNVNHGYKNHPCILRDISLKIYQNELLSLIGESGSGKTTLAKILVGLQKPKQGEVMFHGESSQMIFQDVYNSLTPSMTVKDLIEEPLILKYKKRRIRISKTDLRQKVMELIEDLGISREDLNRYPSSFSGGQRQRLAIARAVIALPDLMVCDEPVSALDEDITNQVVDTLDKLKRKHEMTCVVISHDLKLVQRISNHIAVMYMGYVVEYGTAREIFEEPLHPYTRILLSCAGGCKNKSETGVIDCHNLNTTCGCPFASECEQAVSSCFKAAPPYVFKDEHMVRCQIYQLKEV